MGDGPSDIVVDVELARNNLGIEVLVVDGYSELT